MEKAVKDRLMNSDLHTPSCRYAASPVLRDPVVLKNNIEVRGRIL